MKYLLTLFASAMIMAPAASASEVGDVVELTPNLQGRVLEANGENHKVAIFANPDNKPTGELKLQNTYFIGDNTYTVTTVESKGFANCDITGITVGPDLYSLFPRAFYGCTKLKYFKEAQPGSVELVGDLAFGYTYALESISLPAAVRVGAQAFMRSAITSASFPAVEYIDGMAFYECYSLATFVGGEKVRTIGNTAFCNDHALKGMTLGPELTSMGTMTFAFDVELTEAVVPSALTAMGKNSFQGTPLNRVFVLSPSFMDFCDESRLLCNSNLKTVYCLPSLEYEIKYYLSSGSEENPVSTLSKATVAPITDVMALESKGNNRYAAVLKLDGITDLHIYDAATGTELRPVGDLYEINCEDVRFSYRINDINLLDYTMKLSQTGAVDDIEVSDEEGVVEYYNLQGVRVSDPHNGVYIRRTAKGASLIAL